MHGELLWHTYGACTCTTNRHTIPLYEVLHTYTHQFALLCTELQNPVADRQTDRQTDTQTDTQTNRQTDSIHFNHACEACSSLFQQ